MAAGRHLKMASTADSLLELAKENGLPETDIPPKDSLEYKKLCHALLRGMCEVILPREIERIKGNYRSEYEDRFNAPVAPAPTVAPPQAKDEGEPLSKLVRDFVGENAKANRWRDRSRRDAEGCLALFLRIVGGERRIGTLSRKDLAGFRDTLTRWPSNANKRYPGRSIQEVLAMAEASFLSVTTVNNHLGYVSQLFSWCVSNEYADRNIAKGLMIRRKEVGGEDDGSREAFSREDMLRMLRSPLYTAAPSKRSAERWWIPLVLMLEGLRLNEAAQLATVDIKSLSDIPCIDVNAGSSGQTLKSRSAARRVPLHPLLIELGFLDFVEEMRAAGQKRLFPNLKLKRGTFAQDISRWWGRFVRKHVTTSRKKVAAHSLRHGFIDSLKQNRADAAVLKELVGHSHGANALTLSVYGKQYEPKTLLDEMLKLHLGIEDELKKLPRW